MKNDKKQIDKLYKNNKAVKLDSEVGKVRRAVFPLIESLMSKLVDRIKIIMPTQPAPVVNFKAPPAPIVKVNVPPQKTPIVKVTEKKVIFPPVQRVEGLVEVKKIEQLTKAVSDLSDILLSQPAPVFKLKDGESIPVKIMEFTDIQSAGGTASKIEEKVWLREEYTYTTINSTEVVTRIKKWDNDNVLTEDFAYDANANPTTKTRRLGSHKGNVGT